MVFEVRMIRITRIKIMFSIKGDIIAAFVETSQGTSRCNDDVIFRKPMLDILVATNKTLDGCHIHKSYK